LCTVEFAAHIEAGGVDDAHAFGHERLGAAALVNALQFGQLRGAVDAGHLRRVSNDVGHHGHAIGDGELDDIGQVKLLLGILIVQTRQPGFEQARGHGHDAAVDLADLALCIAGVFLLDDGLYLPGSAAHDAAVAGGVGHLDGEQGQLVARAGGDQGLQGVGLGERHIARKDNDQAVVGQVRHSLLHSVAGAQLGHLAGELQAFAAVCGAERGFDLFGAMTGDDHGLACLQLTRGVDDMAYHGLARHRVKHLG